MSVRNANGNVFGGAMRRPSVLIAMAATLLAVGGAVALTRLDTSSTTTPSRQPEPAVLVPQPQAPATEMRESSTVFIVFSEEQATVFRTNIEDGNRVRDAQGLSPINDLVVVATNDAQAAELEAGYANTNQMLVSLGYVPMKVVRQLAPSAGTTIDDITAESIAREHEQYIAPYILDR